jgi:hypothetical protein
MWRALRGAGLPILASWIDVDIDDLDYRPTPSRCTAYWMRRMEEAAAATIVILYLTDSEVACDELMEVGAAINAGAQVFLVSSNWLSFEHLPSVRRFPDIEGAVEAIRARMHGEEAREHALQHLHANGRRLPLTAV